MPALTPYLCRGCQEDARNCTRGVRVNEKQALVVPMCTGCVKMNRSIGLSVFKGIVEPYLKKKKEEVSME